MGKIDQAINPKNIYKGIRFYKRLCRKCRIKIFKANKLDLKSKPSQEQILKQADKMNEALNNLCENCSKIKEGLT